MSNNLKVSIIIILGVIALYISTQYYSGFNKSKTITKNKPNNGVKRSDTLKSERSSTKRFVTMD